ncbi:O-methyltransferase [Halomonas koreensis]|uniref:Class I SAM-dependent methyltransferase n=1 Tax=Halomonas koreensis TaxID=245385 RepID=A0ABU1G4E4_9GAMM|nr:class I SAM-dependent methyltransferase [Halomonas koreensis]MDR5867770.1 class I SAM-dependent methyltransferase [Halomonas koreensis]
MDAPPSLERWLAELAAHGERHDAAVDDPARRLRNITPDTGRFLDVQVRATGARRILEAGTSNGYSTLWLARGARATGGRVTTVECDAERWTLARRHFAAAGVEALVDALHADIGTVLADQAPASLDLIFLDADRERYLDWWPAIREALAPGGLLVVDNALSHAEALAPFMARVEADPAFTGCRVPVGKGEFLATRDRGAPREAGRG